MARPLSATDDEILQKAQALFQRRGADGFTISELAREVGLSRTAITLRFGGIDEVKRRTVERNVAEFERRFKSLKLEHGPNGLLEIADTIARMLGDRANFSSFILTYSTNLQDPILQQLEERRGEFLRELITLVMPETRIDKPGAVDAFLAHLSGSILYWQTADAPDTRAFMRRRTLDWLQLAGLAGPSAES